MLCPYGWRGGVLGGGLGFAPPGVREAVVGTSVPTQSSGPAGAQSEERMSQEAIGLKARLRSALPPQWRRMPRPFAWLAAMGLGDGVAALAYAVGGIGAGIMRPCMLSLPAPRLVMGGYAIVCLSMVVGVLAPLRRGLILYAAWACAMALLAIWVATRPPYSWGFAVFYGGIAVLVLVYGVWKRDWFGREGADH
jgi:hypothetical protein